MSVWKRWSWRYRIGAIFALALLLQGSQCPGPLYSILPRYPVPGVDGPVVPEKFYFNDHYGHYYLVYRHGAFWHVYEHSPEYIAIESYFRTRPDLYVVRFDRSALPGGAASLPNPPVQ